MIFQKAAESRPYHQKTVLLKVFTISAFQIFLDPIQKRALSRSVQLEAVYLEALLYINKKNPARLQLKI